MVLRVASVLAAVAALAFAQGVGAASDAAAAKLAEVEAATGGSSSLLTLTDKNFAKFATDADRPYHLFVLFNAPDGLFKCEVCTPFQEEVGVAAASYAVARSEGNGGSPPIFFAVAMFNKNRNAFGKFMLKGVPQLVHFAPTGARPIDVTDIPAGWKYAADHFLAENVENFVRGKTGAAFAIKRSPWPAIMALLMLTTVAVLALRFAFKPLLELALTLRDFKPLWVFIAFTFFFVAVSGILYDIIRGVPWITLDPATRKPVVVIAQNGTQTVLEGLLIGALNIACALAVIALTHWSRFLGSAATKTTVALGVLGVFFFAYSSIVMMYRYKNRWYMQFS